MKHVRFISAVALLVSLAQSSNAAFSLASHAFGDTAGQPYRTSDGSGFFVHSSSDAGDNTPSVIRPLHSSSWTGEIGNDIEWTSYMSHDRLGPSRRSGTPNNSADTFYINAGVYPAAFVSRNAAVVTLTPGHDALARRAVVDGGVLFGGSFIAAPPVASGPAPVRIYGGSLTAEGVFLARLTVKSSTPIGPNGTPISGAVQLIGSFGTSDLVLNSGISANGVFLNAYRVATVTLSDAGFDTGSGSSEDFSGASVDVWDIWVEEATFPAPGAVALFGAAGLAGLRRRRA